MSARSWMQDGVDARRLAEAQEAADREGVSLEEYLAQAIARRQSQAPAPTSAPRTPRTEPKSPESAAGANALAHRVDTIERRVRIAEAGLSEAVETSDRSIHALASRIDEAEGLAQGASEAVAGALRQFETAMRGLDGRVAEAQSGAERARAAAESRHDAVERKFDGLTARQKGVEARLDDAEARTRETERVAREALDGQRTLNEEIAREFEEMEAAARRALAETVEETREAARIAGQYADAAAARALDEIRRISVELEAKVADAAGEARALNEALSERVDAHEAQTLEISQDLFQRINTVEETAKTAWAETNEEWRASELRLNQDIALLARQAQERDEAVHDDLSAALEDVRQGQFETATRLALIDEGLGLGDAGAGGTLGQRVAELEAGALTRGDIAPFALRLAQAEAALTAKVDVGPLEARLADIEDGLDRSDLDAAIIRLERAIKELADRPTDKLNPAAAARLDALGAKIDANARDLESVRAGRRAMEQRVESLSGEIEGVRLAQRAAEDAASRHPAFVDARMDEMAEVLAGRLDDMRQEFAGWVENAQEQARALARSEATDDAIGHFEIRLADRAKVQDQAVAALSAEFQRLSRSLDGRLKAVELFCESAVDRMIGKDEFASLAERIEARLIEQADRSGAARIGQEIGEIRTTLEDRFLEIERREDLTARRLEGDIDGIRQRMEDRFSDIERRSVRAIERLGEQVELLSRKMSRPEGPRPLDLVERVEGEPQGRPASRR